MKTLQDEWKTYRDMIYPKGVSAIQNRECHQAFFAGAGVTLKLLDDLSHLPTSEAIKELSKLAAESGAVLGAACDTLKGKN